MPAEPAAPPGYCSGGGSCVGGSIGPCDAAARVRGEYAPAVEAASYSSTFGFWFWSKKDLCRVDMEMVGSVSVKHGLNAKTRREWPITLGEARARHHVAMRARAG